MKFLYFSWTLASVFTGSILAVILATNACQPGGRVSLVPPYDPRAFPCTPAGKLCPGGKCCGLDDACGGAEPGCFRRHVLLRAGREWLRGIARSPSAVADIPVSVAPSCYFCREPATGEFRQLPACAAHQMLDGHRVPPERSPLEEAFYQGRRAGLAEARDILTLAKGPDKLNVCLRCMEASCALHKLLQ